MPTTNTDYKGRAARKKTHRRYSDQAGRPDLMALALCCDLAGPVIGSAYLTSDPGDVTCGRCRRIMGVASAAEDDAVAAIAAARFDAAVLSAARAVAAADRPRVLEAIMAVKGTHSMSEKEEKRHAYTMLEDEPESGQYSVGICERGVAGYRLVPDYGPYEDKARTSGIVGRLNERIGVSAEEADAIVGSTFAKPFKAKKAAGGRR